MRRGWKILIGVVVALAVLLALNAVSIDNETKAAEVTVPGGQDPPACRAATWRSSKGARAMRSPIVLIHCFTCAIDWWDGMMPAPRPRPPGRRRRPARPRRLGKAGLRLLDRRTRPTWSPRRWNGSASRDAEVVGHSLGGTVAVALAEQSRELVKRLVIVDQAPDIVQALARKIVVWGGHSCPLP